MDEKKIVYKRVLLKLSGEALSGDAGTGLDFKVCLLYTSPSPRD